MVKLTYPNWIYSSNIELCSSKLLNLCFALRKTCFGNPKQVCIVKLHAVAAAVWSRCCLCSSEDLTHAFFIVCCLLPFFIFYVEVMCMFSLTSTFSNSNLQVFCHLWEVHIFNTWNGDASFFSSLSSGQTFFNEYWTISKSCMSSP